MIDNFNLTFQPKTRDDFQLYESILKRFQYKRNVIIESINDNIKLFIFTDKQFLQFKVFHLNEYLRLNEITNRDYIQFENQFNKDINHLGLSLDKLTITRVDYKLDMRLSPVEIQEYLYIFSKLRQRYYSLEKRVYYNLDKTNIESVYYKGSFNINIYDKDLQLRKKGVFDPLYENVLRLEIQVKSRYISDYCKSHGMSKELVNFSHSAIRDEFFNDLLIDKFLYSGDYYNLKNVKKQINDIKLSTQQKIIKFCKHIVKEDITEAINTLSSETASKYIKELTNRNINPITIKNLNSLLGIKSILEEKAKAM